VALPAVVDGLTVDVVVEGAVLVAEEVLVLESLALDDPPVAASEEDAATLPPAASIWVGAGPPVTGPARRSSSTSLSASASACRVCCDCHSRFGWARSVAGFRASSLAACAFSAATAKTWPATLPRY
jgi:hypothetical protein